MSSNKNCGCSSQTPISASAMPAGSTNAALLTPVNSQAVGKLSDQCCNKGKTAVGCLTKTANIVDQGHCCEPASKMIYALALKLKGNMPTCGGTSDLLFDADLTGFPTGIDISSPVTGPLTVVRVLGTDVLVVQNPCNGLQLLSPGEAIPTGTKFVWGPTQYGLTGDQDPDLVYLTADFIVPEVGNCNPAKVSTISGLTIGSIYKIQGEQYRLSDKLDNNTIKLCNDGNGAVVNSTIYYDPDGDGEPEVPLIQVGDADVCSGSPVASGKIVACKNGEPTTLKGVSGIDIPFWNPITNEHDMKAIFSSEESGPHVIDYDAENKTYTLKYCPEACSEDCKTLECCLELSTANTSNIYDIQISSSAGLSTTAPGNVITIGGRDYDIIAILGSAKIRIRPRFTVSVDETIEAGTSACVASGCLPRPDSDYSAAYGVYAGDPDDGMPVFCANDGLRTLPGYPGSTSISELVQSNTLDITSTDRTRSMGNVSITNNSNFRNALALIILEITDTFDVHNQGRWTRQVLLDGNVIASHVFKVGAPVRAGYVLTTTKIEVLAPGQTLTLPVQVTMDNTAASTSTNDWESCSIKVNAFSIAI
jgi:hypothetical protein